MSLLFKLHPLMPCYCHRRNISSFACLVLALPCIIDIAGTRLVNFMINYFMMLILCWLLSYAHITQHCTTNCWVVLTADLRLLAHTVGLQLNCWVVHSPNFLQREHVHIRCHNSSASQSLCARNGAIVLRPLGDVLLVVGLFFTNYSPSWEKIPPFEDPGLYDTPWEVGWLSW